MCGSVPSDWLSGICSWRILTSWHNLYLLFRLSSDFSLWKTQHICPRRNARPFHPECVVHLAACFTNNTMQTLTAQNMSYKFCVFSRRLQSVRPNQGQLPEQRAGKTKARDMVWWCEKPTHCISMQSTLHPGRFASRFRTAIAVLEIWWDVDHQGNCATKQKQPTNPIAVTKTLLWKELFPQPCTVFPCNKTSVDCGAWNGVECRVWSVKTVECGVGNVQGMKWGLWSLK